MKKLLEEWQRYIANEAKKTRRDDEVDTEKPAGEDDPKEPAARPATEKEKEEYKKAIDRWLRANRDYQKERRGELDRVAKEKSKKTKSEKSLSVEVQREISKIKNLRKQFETAHGLEEKERAKIYADSSNYVLKYATISQEQKDDMLQKMGFNVMSSKFQEGDTEDSRRFHKELMSVGAGDASGKTARFLLKRFYQSRKIFSKSKTRFTSARIDRNSRNIFRELSPYMREPYKDYNKMLQGMKEFVNLCTIHFVMPNVYLRMVGGYDKKIRGLLKNLPPAEYIPKYNMIIVYNFNDWFNNPGQYLRSMIYHELSHCKDFSLWYIQKRHNVFKKLPRSIRVGSEGISGSRKRLSRAAGQLASGMNVAQKKVMTKIFTDFRWTETGKVVGNLTRKEKRRLKTRPKHNERSHELYASAEEFLMAFGTNKVHDGQNITSEQIRYLCDIKHTHKRYDPTWIIVRGGRFMAGTHRLAKKRLKEFLESIKINGGETSRGRILTSIIDNEILPKLRCADVAGVAQGLNQLAKLEKKTDDPTKASDQVAIAEDKEK